MVTRGKFKYSLRDQTQRPFRGCDDPNSIRKIENQPEMSWSPEMVVTD